MDFRVLSNFKQPLLIPFSVNADGTKHKKSAVLDSAKTATGVYELTIKRPFQTTPFVFASCGKTGSTRHIIQAPIASADKNTVVLKTYNLSDSANDAPFEGFVLGAEGREPYYGVIEQKVCTPMNNARMLFFHYNGATPAMQAGLNQHEGTFTKQGTGLYTLTLKRPFSLEPYCIVQSFSTTRIVEWATKSATEITFESFNSSSAAAADSEFLVILIGQMSKYEELKMAYPLRCPHPFTYLNPFLYDGSADDMLLGEGYMSASKASTTYTFTDRRVAQKASYGLCLPDGAAVLSGVNTRTGAGFNVDVEADAKVQCLEIAMRRGRIW